MTTDNYVANQKIKGKKIGCEFTINGKMGRVRPVRKSDVVLIDEMHDRVSKDSLYFRYLGTNKPSKNNLSRLCSHGFEDGMVFVAEIDEPNRQIVALAFYCRDPKDPTLAEPAMLVEDRYQGCGLGKKIMSAIYKDAACAGIKSFISFIHPVNHKVLGLIKGSGLQYNCKYNQGLKEVTIRLPAEHP